MHSSHRTRRWVTNMFLALSMLLVAAPAAAAETTTEAIGRSPLCAFLDAGLTNAEGGVRATFTLSVLGQWGYLYGGETITFTPGSVPAPGEAVLTLSVRTSGNGFDPVATSDAGAGSVTWTAPRLTLTALRANVSTGDFHGMTWTCAARQPGPATSIDELRGTVEGLGLAGGITQALDSKLEVAWEAASSGEVAGACGALAEFRQLVSAQDGKKLSAPHAAQLGEAASAIESSLDC